MSMGSKSSFFVIRRTTMASTCRARSAGTEPPLVTGCPPRIALILSQKLAIALLGYAGGRLEPEREPEPLVRRRAHGVAHGGVGHQVPVDAVRDRGLIFVVAEGDIARHLVDELGGLACVVERSIG